VRDKLSVLVENVEKELGSQSQLCMLLYVTDLTDDILTSSRISVLKARREKLLERWLGKCLQDFL
jgi:hypothetical protein